MKIKAILFDLDGTLRDTREAIYSSLERALEVHAPRVPSREEMGPVIHHHTEVHRTFAPDADSHAFEESYREKVTDMVNESVLYDGVHEIVQQLHKTGYKLAIVSAASRLEQYVQKAGLVEFFDAFVGGNTTTEHKPHPAPVLLALEQLGVKAEEAIMVGDLAADIQAAQAAGVQATIGITHGFGTRTSLEQAGADHIIDSLPELVPLIKKLST
jgi:HAD superfamily hydrolase (TIGR01509 family)